MPTLYSKQRRILKTCSLEQNITVKLVSRIRTSPLSFSSTKEQHITFRHTACCNSVILLLLTEQMSLNIEKDDESNTPLDPTSIVLRVTLNPFPYVHTCIHAYILTYIHT